MSVFAVPYGVSAHGNKGKFMLYIAWYRDQLVNVDQMRQRDERITIRSQCHEQIIKISAVLCTVMALPQGLMMLPMKMT